MNKQQARTKALELVPDRTPASLLDVACLYAAGDVYEKLTSDNVDFNVETDALQAMTPAARNECFDPESEQKVIAINIDATSSPAELGEPVVTVENCTPDHFYRIGYIGNSSKTGPYGDDYSITNHINGKTADAISNDGGGRFARGRFERWMPKYAEDAIEMGHQNASLIQNLLTLEDNTSALERIEDAVKDKLPSDESIEGFVTVRIKQPGTTEYRYPGEIDVLNQIALERKYDHIRDGIGIEDKYSPNGQGVDYVTGESGEVIGGSSGILNQYSKKHADKFSRLNMNNAYKALPVSVETDLTFTIFGSIRDEFSFLQNHIRFFYLPYPKEEVTEPVFKEFYETIYKQLKGADSDDIVSVLNSIAPDTSTPPEDVTGLSTDALFTDTTDTQMQYRVYNIAFLSDDPDRIISDNTDINLDGITNIANAYSASNELLGEHTVFDDVVANLAFPNSSTVREWIMSADWFWQLTAESPDPGEDKNTSGGTLSDGRLKREGNLLQGNSIDRAELLEQYVTLLIRGQREGWLFTQTNDSTIGALPFRQYAQLVALETTGVTYGKGINDYSVIYSTLMDETTDTPEERLDAFLEANNALDGDGAKSVFLLGALVGRLTAQQSRPGKKQVSRKMSEQYPIERVNKRTIQDITGSVIAKNEEYATRDDYLQLNQRYIERMGQNALQDESPDAWELTDVEMKWLYAFGISYGKNDTTDNTDSDFETNN